MRQTILLFVTAATLGMAGSTNAQTPTASSSADSYTLENCLVTLIQKAQVPAREAGQLMSMEVREGQRVKAGQLLAQIEDDKPKKQMELAELEFQVAVAQYENDVDKRYYEKAAEASKVDMEDAQLARVRVPRSVSDFEMRRRVLTLERSTLQIEQADRDHKVAGMNAAIANAKVKVAENEIERRRVVAPFHGVVAETFPNAGEWVNPGDPILRLLRMDRLRVEGFVNAADFAPNEIFGRPVTVEVTLARDRVERFTGTIGFVSPDVEANGEYRVWAEIDNRSTDGGFYLVHPGLTATMTLDVRGAAVGASKASGR